MSKKTTYFCLFASMLIYALLVNSVAAISLPNSKQDIVSELITLKDKNSSLQKEIGLLDNRLDTIDSHLTKLNNKIIETEFNLNKEIKILSQRAKAMYKDSRYHTTLQLILESKSIYELITRLDFFGKIIKQDFKLVQESKVNRKKLIGLKNDFISKRQKIVIFKQAKQNALNEYRTVKVKLQSRLKVANQQQLNQVNVGLDSIKIYNNYLMSKRSPMAGLGITFVTAGQRYAISPDLVIAISGVESTFGAHNAGSYNAWGRKARGGGYMSFGSWQEAIINQTTYLRERYFNRGLTNPTSIGRKYAPGNGSWPGKVNYWLNDIKAYKLSNK